MYSCVQVKPQSATPSRGDS